MFGINDPSALLRPWKNLQQFSEELYAMFSKGGAPAGGTPVDTRVQAPDQPARPRANREVQDGSRLDATRKTRLESARAGVKLPDPPGRDSHATQTRTPQAGQEEASRPRPEPTRPEPQTSTSFVGAQFKPKPYEAPRPETKARPQAADDHTSTRRSADQTDHSSPVPPLLGGGPSRAKEVRQARPAGAVADPVAARNKKEADAKRQSQEPSKRSSPYQDVSPSRPRRDGNDYKEMDIGDFANAPAGGGGGTTTFLGKVESGSGDTYKVTLYQNGPKGSPDAQPVDVTVPMIDPSDQIPAGTWIAPIFQFPAPADEFGNAGTGSVYSCQPPVWMP